MIKVLVKSNASQMNIVTKKVVKKLLKSKQYSNGGNEK